MNFNLHFGELHSNNSINDKNNLFENHIPKCYKVKRILISFNCFSEYKMSDSKAHGLMGVPKTAEFYPDNFSSTAEGIVLNVF